MSALKLGRSWALRATGPFYHCGRVKSLVWGRRENRQSLAPDVLRCPFRRTVLSSEKTVTAFFFKKNAVVMIAQGADADEIMVEVVHDLPGGGEEVGEKDVADGGRAVGCAAGGADADLKRVRVDVGAGRLRRKVETAGAGVCNCCVCRRYGRWFGRWWGWATASSR